MSTATVSRKATRAVVPVLAAHEARRLVTHPVTLIGWGMLAFMFAVSAFEISSPVAAFDAISTGTAFYPGIFCVLAAHMVATRDRRAGTDELLDAVPATREQRVYGLLIAAWAPALIALVVNVLALRYLIWRDAFVEVPGLGHLLQGPVTVLGGCVLGIMLGLWLPQRVTPVLAMVALVAVSMSLGSREAAGLFAPMVSWVDWGPYDGTRWYALESGNPGPHVVYLLGLCGMAAVAALLRATTHRRLAVALGFLSLAVTVWGGMAQLP
jgi:hypothetical protein